MTYNGATGGGASAKALAASAPIVMKLFIAVAAQKILAPVCSREEA